MKITPPVARPSQTPSPRFTTADVKALSPVTVQVPSSPARIPPKSFAEPDGAVVTDRRETTGPAKGFRIARDFAADGTEFLRIDAVDAKGNRVLSFGKTVEVSLEGGELIGIDNGDPLSHESQVHPVHNLFHGSLLAVVKRTGGPLKVTVLNKSRDHGTLQTTETIR